MAVNEPGGRFELSRPLKLGRDAPTKLAARDITADEVRALLSDHVIVDIVEERDRYVISVASPAERSSL
ncbi:MAG: hypothetical protein M3O70_22070 [Actinomycetota bacterium]|nr:hypothetical protein [Actinomycetota bacterium]